MKRFCVMAAAGHPAGIPANRCKDAFGRVPGESWNAAKVLYTRTEGGDRGTVTAPGLGLTRGEGMAPDDPAAMHWFEKAGAKGDTVAQTTLGVCLTRRVSPEEKRAEGVGWLEKAAKGGNPVASANLAMLYRTDRGGIPENGAPADRWPEWGCRLAGEKTTGEMEQFVRPYHDVLSARAGEQDGRQLVKSVKAVAVFAPGDLLWSGSGWLERNPEVAQGWLKMAAGRGHVKSMAMYGFLRVNGLHGGMDLAKGLAYPEGSARRFPPEAHMVPVSYWRGEGGREEAAQVFRKTVLCRDCVTEGAIRAWRDGAGDGPVRGEPEKITEIRHFSRSGGPGAMLYRGRVCEVGITGRRDVCKVSEWYEKAAQKGGNAVCLPLAMVGVETGDFTCARKWRDAAVCRTGKREDYYPFMLAFGQDSAWLDDREEANGKDWVAVSGDRVKGRSKRLRWLEREGRRGDGAAAVVLGRLCREGIGVAEDGKRSAMWRLRAEKAHVCRCFSPGGYLSCEEGRDSLRDVKGKA